MDHLTQVHPVSSRAADRTPHSSSERPLERRSFELRRSIAAAATTLKRTALCTLNTVKLPPNPSHRLLLSRRERENPPARSAESGVVIVEDPLVTVDVADVSESG